MTRFRSDDWAILALMLGIVGILVSSVVINWSTVPEFSSFDSFAESLPKIDSEPYNFVKARDMLSSLVSTFEQKSWAQGAIDPFGRYGDIAVICDSLKFLAGAIHQFAVDTLPPSGMSFRADPGPVMVAAANLFWQRPVLRFEFYHKPVWAATFYLSLFGVVWGVVTLAVDR